MKREYSWINRDVRFLNLGFKRKLGAMLKPKADQMGAKWDQMGTKWDQVGTKWGPIMLNGHLYFDLIYSNACGDISSLIVSSVLSPAYVHTQRD